MLASINDVLEIKLIPVHRAHKLDQEIAEKIARAESAMLLPNHRNTDNHRLRINLHRNISSRAKTAQAAAEQRELSDINDQILLLSGRKKELTAAGVRALSARQARSKTESLNASEPQHEPANVWYTFLRPCSTSR